MNLKKLYWVPMTDEDVEFLNNPAKKVPTEPTNT